MLDLATPEEWKSELIYVVGYRLLHMGEARAGGLGAGETTCGVHGKAVSHAVTLTTELH